MTETWDIRVWHLRWLDGVQMLEILDYLFPWFIFFREGPYLPLGLGRTFPPRRYNLLEILYFNKFSVWFCLSHCRSKICRHLFRGCLAPLQVGWNSHSLSKLKNQKISGKTVNTYYSTSFTFILRFFLCITIQQSLKHAIFLHTL